MLSHTLPNDSQVIQEIFSIFKLRSEINFYRSIILDDDEKIEELNDPESRKEFIEKTIDIVSNSKILPPFEQINSFDLSSYISKRIESLYLSVQIEKDLFWNGRMNICYNIGSLEDRVLIDLEVFFDEDFNVTNAEYECEEGVTNNKHFTRWAIKYSN